VTAEGKTHWHGKMAYGHRILYCSGRAVFLTNTTSRLDDVTCGACRRKLLTLARKGAAAA
jgi:hypothetical protein